MHARVKIASPQKSSKKYGTLPKDGDSAKGVAATYGAGMVSAACFTNPRTHAQVGATHALSARLSGVASA